MISTKFQTMTFLTIKMKKQMKKGQLILKSVLIIALMIAFLNCTKDVVEPTPPNVNHSTFTDLRDNKTYKTIKIGNQEWMAENLAFKTETGSWTYWGSESNGAKYGRLYTLDAAILAVPSGWHLPTDTEWKQLEIILGMSQTEADKTDYRGTDEAGKLKAKSGWAENGNGNDEVGFTALPGGFRPNSGNFLTVGYYGYWWSATENPNSKAWIRLIVTSSSKILRIESFKEDAYSVRCVKN